MIIFKKIRYKNFLSSGNITLEVNLNEYKTTCIWGGNGQGKTSISEAIYFNLFGKSFRKANKPQLINSINKRDCLTELELNIQGKEYLIRRGLKPNILEFYCNGILLNQDSSSLDYQKYFEENILKMNSRSFLQIVMLSTMNYTPFMQLPAMGRRDIIEDLLDLKIFSKMNVIGKDELNNIKSLIIDKENNIKSIKKQIDLNNKHLLQLKENNKDLIKSKKEYITSLNNSIVELKEKEKKYTKEINEYKRLDKNLEKINDIISDLDKKSNKLCNENKVLNKEINYYMTSSECSRCRQYIDDDFKWSIILKFEKTKEDNDKELKNIEELLIKNKNYRDTLLKVKKERDDIIENRNEVSISITNINSTIDRYKSEIASIIEKTKNIVKDDITGHTLNEELNNEENELSKLIEEREILNYCLTFLKDDGIKSKIIGKYIPIINNLISKYLNMLDFFISFELNENFEESMKSRYRDDQSFENLSEGEKSRINLALLFTWREISRMRNTFSTNLLFLDEVFDSSLDSSGSEELIKILNNLSKDSNIFVISHKENMIDKFDNNIHVKKINNFSVFV